LQLSRITVVVNGARVEIVCRIAVEALMKNETESLQSQAAATTQNDNMIASLKDDIVTLKDDVKRLQCIAMTEHVAAAAADAAAAAVCRWFAAPLGPTLVQRAFEKRFFKNVAGVYPRLLFMDGEGWGNRLMQTGRSVLFRCKLKTQSSSSSSSISSSLSDPQQLFLLRVMRPLVFFFFFCTSP
jgi:hypothetical protein